jgi:uncharacterized protein YhbP (UPF0306 family)
MVAAAQRLLDASRLCAIATVGRNGRAHVNTAYFAWSAAFDLVWLSEPRARHSRNIRGNGSVAVAVYDSRQRWGGRDCGVQLFGAAEEVAGAAAAGAAEVYAGRFPPYRKTRLGEYRFYVFRPRLMKLFDEREFGAGVFVTARVARGRLAWERTELSVPDAPEL